MTSRHVQIWAGISIMASEDEGSDVSNEILYYNKVSEESSDGSEGKELDLHVIEPYPGP